MKVNTINKRTKRNAVKKTIIFILLAACLLSCSTELERCARHTQKTLIEQEKKAEYLTEKIITSLGVNSFDSLWNITQQEQDILIYVFDRKGMVYWSDNWLAGQQIFLKNYNVWFYQRFDNAHCVCRWEKAGNYNILTVIPVATAYSISNHQLRNTFLHPFKKYSNIGITTISHENSLRIYNDDQSPLFSLEVIDSKLSENQEEFTHLAESFSYQTLVEQDDTNNKHSRGFYFYFILELILFAAIIIFGIIGLIRNKGWKNMRLRVKFQYATITLILFMSVYVFAITAVSARDRYSNQQRQSLERKTKYIQKALQDMYFWNLNLSQKNTAGLSIDLRDMSFAYETDIHVYDMQGTLVGTSAPMLFDKGLMSKHIAPEPFFTGKSTMMQYEYIGDMRYLAAYTEFINGNYEQIGYIAVPLFISTEAIDQATDDFLSKLLLPNLLVLVLTFIVSFIVARSMTRPLSVIADHMRRLKIGQKADRLEYNNHDELGELVMRYNEMVDQLEISSEKLARSEREGAWRTMARQIAHEINNPLTPMKLTIQQLQRLQQAGDERFEAYFKKSTTMLIEQIDNLSKIAQSFSQFAKMPEVITTEVDIARKLSTVIALFRNNQSQTPIRYIGAESGVMAKADEEQISQVFNNIIKNALQAIENKEDGDIIVILKQENNNVEISISDNGYGIPEQIQEKIFLPNFTTKNTGMGLGLAISKNIVEGSGGTIRFTTSNKGTTFYITLKI